MPDHEAAPVKLQNIKTSSHSRRPMHSGRPALNSAGSQSIPMPMVRTVTRGIWQITVLSQQSSEGRRVPSFPLKRAERVPDKAAVGRGALGHQFSPGAELNTAVRPQVTASQANSRVPDCGADPLSLIHI